jgi:hypothetical protein
MKTMVAALILLLAQAQSSYAQCFFCSSEKKSFLAACLKAEPAATYDICACVWEAESKLYNPDERALITAYLAGDEQTKANYVRKNGAAWAQELEKKAKASGAAARTSCRPKR